MKGHPNLKIAATVRPLALVLTIVLIGALAPTGTTAHAAVPERLVVSLEDVGEDELRAAVVSTGGEIVRVDDALGFAIVTTARPAALYERFDGAVSPDVRGYGATDLVVADVPNDTYFPVQWSKHELKLEQAWAIEPGSRSVRVAVVDSGIDPSHPDLASVPMVFGTDYVDGGLPLDQNNHGTHVAGIVAATRNNGIGVAGTADVTLIVVRVLDQNNAGWCSDFASGIRNAADLGADIVNLSLYCSADCCGMQSALQYAASYDALPIIAAGNFQTSNPSACVTYPARYPEGMAAASTNAALAPSTFSCQGPEVEVAAPGELVLSTVVGTGYTWMSGTSMATPHVAGVAALILSAQPALSASTLRSLLRSTAVDLGPPGHDPAYGDGLVDPVAALTGLPVYVP